MPAALIFLLLCFCANAFAVERIWDDWSQAEKQGWQFLDGKVSGHEGQIGPLENTLRMFDDVGDATGYAILRNDVDFTPKGDCYQIDFTLRMVRLGSMDDSSVDYSTMSLYFSFTGVGLDIDCLAKDRVVFDQDWSQYQMLRNDDASHTFSFLVNRKAKQVRVRKDGIPIGLYKAHSLPENGIRITAGGSEKVPCDLRIERITLADRDWDNLPSQAATRPPEPVLLPAEWPTYLRDPFNTAHSPLKGKSATLKIVNSIPVGGAILSDVFVDDINADGKNEYILLYGGRFRAFDSQGKAMWEYIAAGGVIGVYDLDGDGRPELLLQDTGFPFVALDPNTGKEKYVESSHPEMGAGALKVADLDPTEPGMQVVFFAGREEIGYIASFIPGQKQARLDLEFRFDVKARNFVPEMLLADMDGDEQQEIVVVTYDRMYVYETSDGRPSMFCLWESGRNYGELVAENIDNDPYPELIMHAYELREHLSVLDNDGKNLTLLWDHFFEQNYPIDNKDYFCCENSVQDFDGDGRKEVLLSLYNDTGDERWHVLVVDAITGETRYDIPDRKAEIALATEIPWIVLTKAEKRRSFKGLELYHPKKGSFPITETGTLAKDTTCRNLPLTFGTRGLTGASSRALRPEGISENEFFIQEAKTLSLVRIASYPNPVETQPFCTISMEGHYSLFSINDVNSDGDLDILLESSNDTKLHVIRAKDSRPLISFPIGGAIRVPICAKMSPEDTELTTYFVDSANRLQAWRAVKSTPRKLWEKPVNPRIAVGAPPTVTAFDFDCDGHKEILTGLPENRVALLNANGDIVQERMLQSPPIDWAIGCFTGDDRYDVAVVISPSQTEQKTIALDPAKGLETVWEFNYGPYYGFPAVCDVNRDGIDDTILRSFFMRHILDGRNGLDLYPVTWMQGHHCPTVVYPYGDAKEPLIVYSGGVYSHRVEKLDGTRVWNQWAQSYMKIGCVGDFDGDGRTESAYQSAGTVYDLGSNFSNLKFEPLKESLSRYVRTFDVVSGKETGRLPLDGIIVKGMVSCDIDGDNRDEILLGTETGFLYILGIIDGKLNTEWSHDFGATVCRPTVADVDLDGSPEILVGTEAGMLYILEPEI
ncbi:MAG TPA: VCBS repeat-containing protein [bacterium]|nr:VCBS repeat-containing protein [bacterium]